jgi:hypothetical protein
MHGASSHRVERTSSEPRLLDPRRDHSVHGLSNGRRTALVVAASKICRRDDVTAARETGQDDGRLRCRSGDGRQRHGAADHLPVHHEQHRARGRAIGAGDVSSQRDGGAEDRRVRRSGESRRRGAILPAGRTSRRPCSWSWDRAAHARAVAATPRSVGDRGFQ